MAVIMFYDLETTGLDPEKCGIHQISGIFVANGRAVEKFNYRVKPKEGCLCSEKAMEMAGHTYEEMMASDEYLPMAEVFRKVYDRIIFYCGGLDEKGKIKYGRKIYTGGYNVHHFDGQFMRQWFLDNGANPSGNPGFEWGWVTSGEIDVQLLATAALLLQPCGLNIKNYQQHSVARAFGIKIDESKLHNALYDVEISFEIYRYLVKTGCYKPVEYDDFGKSADQILEERRLKAEHRRSADLVVEERELCNTKIVENSQVNSEQSVKR